MDPLLRAYRRAGFLTDGEVLAAALLRGSTAFCEARALVEAGRENSTAMVVVPGAPPGKNVCGFVRRLVGERSKLIVAATPAGLPPGRFETMLRASMPDVEKKLRIMDVGESVVEAVMSAERNRHYRPSQALEVFAPEEDCQEFAREISAGGLNFDPTVISTVPVRVPSDDARAIEQALAKDDMAALHRVLDPHIFSSPDGLARYQSVRQQNEAVVVRVDTSPAEVAGLCLVARDTCRVLMLQRGLTEDDPAAGTWEFPGGHIEPDESPLAAAYREWQEEVGILLPAELVTRIPDGSWLSSNGIYVGCVVVVPSEECLGLADREQVTNPDDPDDDTFEAVAWWDVEHLFDHPALRPELAADLGMVADAIVGGLEAHDFFCEGREVVSEMAAFSAASVLPALVDMELVPLGTREELGEGYHGLVFPSEHPGMVVKVTPDPEEVAVAKRLVNREMKGIVRVFAVHDIPQRILGRTGRPVQLWAIELERLRQMPDSDFERLSDLDDDLQKEYVDGHFGGGYAEYLRRPENIERLAAIVPSIGNVLTSAGALGLAADLHANNLMVNSKGTVVLADLGPLPQRGPGVKRTSGRPGQQVNELVGTQAAPQAGPQSQMRGSNSSAWSGGRLVLKKPEQHVPEDENASERDGALDQDIVGGGLDWGIGLSGRGF